MNKVLAIDPKAIENTVDWLKIYPHVGHEKGLFMANFPKVWVNEFLGQDFDSDNWDFSDIQKIKEILIAFQTTNTFVSLNSPYQPLLEWCENFLKISEDKRKDCLAFKNRRSVSKLETLDELDPRQLCVNSTIEQKFTPQTLAKNLKIFLQNSPKIAIVDRHNYLVTLNGKSSLFAEFIKQVLIATQSSKCHEIIIYARHDPNRFPYMQSNETLSMQLMKSFEEHITPTYGIKYICCKEYQNNNDLHSRKIVSNHVVFLLSDSIVGNTFSQSITRVSDVPFRESNIKSWIDEEHGLEVKASATFINHRRG